MAEKKRVLLVGSGGIGTITALNLELSDLCAVTAVLRSNFNAVKEKGFKIDAMDYGKFESWRPTELRNRIPDVEKEGLPPYDYVICTTKNTPDVPPPLIGLVTPAISPGKSVIVLIQNGINIEQPFLSKFPENVVLSGISRMGANEPESGFIVQDDPDRLGVAAFHNPNLPEEVQRKAAEDFVKLYLAAGKAQCEYDPNVQYARWRKLIYNCVWNPICALTDCDTGRLRIMTQNPNYTQSDPFALLVHPAMEEVIATAASTGVTLERDLIGIISESEPVETFAAPSMLQDARKGRFTEVENILGEVLRTAEKNKVSVPTIRVMYGLLKAKQWKAMEAWGMVDAKEEAKKREDARKAVGVEETRW